MMNLHTFFQEIGNTDIRYMFVRNCSNDLSLVLEKFGLIPNKSLLVEKNKEETLEILTELLWKNLAYSHERIPKNRAIFFAQQIIMEHQSPDNRYFSNVLWSAPESQSMAALTKSTFDAGIIIASEITKKYFCIWFEDED